MCWLVNFRAQSARDGSEASTRRARSGLRKSDAENAGFSDHGSARGWLGSQADQKTQGLVSGANTRTLASAMIAGIPSRCGVAGSRFTDAGNTEHNQARSHSGDEQDDQGIGP
jgi:hypothetical protein